GTWRTWTSTLRPRSPLSCRAATGRPSNELVRAGTQPWSRPGLHLRTEAADPVDRDTHDESFLAGLTERILVGAEEPFGELVDVLVRAGFRDSRGAVEDSVGLRIVAILDGYLDAG